MTNTNKLKAKIIENGYTMQAFAESIGTTGSRLSIKANNKMKFSQKDITAIYKKLNLTAQEVVDIFLN